jgi:mono/diheme cytochrome c family protein
MKRGKITIAVAAIASAGVLFGIVALVVVSTGAYNVAATTPHTRITNWLMHTTMERSVAARARDVPAAPPLDSGILKQGFAEYDEMCAACHGAPGVERSVLGKGLNPEPPDLAKQASDWNDRELFWITKHGIKMTGMPAFGVTHSDRELWGMVSVLRRLKDMSAEDYRRSVAEAGKHQGMHGVAAESRGEVRTADVSSHAHGGTPASQPMGRAQAQVTDHGRMGHTATAVSRQRSTAQAPPQQAHHQTRGQITAREQRGAAPQIGVDGTAKLKTLAAELLRDPIVREQIRADSALRRRWENPAVRKQLGTPPRSN